MLGENSATTPEHLSESLLWDQQSIDKTRWPSEPVLASRRSSNAVSSMIAYNASSSNAAMVSLNSRSAASIAAS
jgi:hypothetical protein